MFLFSSGIFFVFCINNVYSTENSTPENPHPLIQTGDGLVRGRSGKTVGGEKVYYAFQGIPYAEPPVGRLRFKLHGKKLPVLAWIHGGGFIIGNSSYKSFGPDYILDEEVVFVSFNYRLGVFGFGSTEDSASPGNYGLKDQILALKWVQDNVANFGGDPTKVTIFGESAGSASVSYLLQTDLTKDLFRAAIMQSGSSLCSWALDRRSKDAMFAIGRALNLDTSSSKSLISGLRTVNSKALQNEAIKISVKFTLTNVREGIVFSPVPEEGVVYKYSDEELSRGRFNRKPVIMGVTSNEASIISEFIEPLKNYFERFDNNATGLTPTDLTKNATTVAKAGSEIRSFYFGSSDVKEQPNAVIKFISDDLFNRPVRRTVTSLSKYVQVFYYVFSYAGQLGREDRTLEGVGHSEDNFYIFRRDRNHTIPANDKLTRSRLVKLWTNFAKYTQPTPSKDPLFQNVTWLPTKSKLNELIYLDINTDIKLKRNPFEKNMEFWDKIYKEYGDPPYGTY